MSDTVDDGAPEWAVGHDVEEAAREAEIEERRESERERRSAEAADVLRGGYSGREAAKNDPLLRLRAELGQADAAGDHATSHRLRNEWAAELMRGAGPSGAPAASPAQRPATAAPVPQPPRWVPVRD